MFFIYNLGEKEIVPSAGWGRGGEGGGGVDGGGRE